MPMSDNGKFQLCEPVGYLESLYLQKHAQFVITDSGGIQEETTVLQIPCLTLRENTERPVTISEGTNTLIGQNMPLLLKEVENILNGQRKSGRIPAKWDGKSSERIAAILTTIDSA
jgi:UDP-N-acetylglucosamine 2-epimerase (non-hydrolysing)